MKNTMDKMIREATANLAKSWYGSSSIKTEAGVLSVTVSRSRSPSGYKFYLTRNWTLNGEKIAAAAVLKLPCPA